jgi:hypothetical protein
MTVVVGEVLGQDVLEMTTSDDEDPVQTFSADGADQALSEGVRPRGSNRGLDDPDASVRNTSLNLAVNFVSRSRMRNLTAPERSAKTTLRLRACRVTHCPTGLGVTPERWTQRVSISKRTSRRGVAGAPRRP